MGCTLVTDGDQSQEKAMQCAFFFWKKKKCEKPDDSRMRNLTCGMNGEGELGVGVCSEGLDVLMKDYLQRYQPIKSSCKNQLQ